MAVIRDAKKVKEHEHGKLYGKPNHQHEVTLIGDLDHFPKDCWVVGRTVAQGQYGKIRFAMSCFDKDDRLLAVKELRTAAKLGVPKLKGKTAKTNPSTLDSIQQEMGLMELVKSKLQFIAMLKIETKDKKSFNYYGVMPAMAGDLYDLRDLFEKEKVADASKRLVGRYVMREVAADLEKCHAANRVHNDLKPDNILFSADQVAVADYGLAQDLQKAKKGLIDLTGSPAYWPWEIMGDPVCIYDDLLYDDPVRNTVAWSGAFDIFALAMIWGELLVPRSEDHRNHSTLWLPYDVDPKPHPDLKLRAEANDPSLKAWFVPLATARSAFHHWHAGKDASDLEAPAKTKIWEDKSKRDTFDAGFARLFAVDDELLEFAWKEMFPYDPRRRSSATEVKERADDLLKDAGGELKAKGVLASLVKRLAHFEEREHLREALRMAKEELKKAGGKLTQSKPSLFTPVKPQPIISIKPAKPLMTTKPAKPNLPAKPTKPTPDPKAKQWRCRYCGATFKFKPIWCRCNRPANTADGPTFEEV